MQVTNTGVRRPEYEASARCLEGLEQGAWGW